MKSVGVLTGGGDCPGLNAVLVGIVRKAVLSHVRTIGVLKGWGGMMDNEALELNRDSVKGIIFRGGTVLRSSRTNPFKHENGKEKVIEHFKKMGLDALIVIGGEDTLGTAYKFHLEGLPIIGVPKTIDNDLPGTDRTFGFDTAVNIATEAIDRLHSTAESHDRVIVVEVMGRNSGWIALQAGMAGGADVIMIPEFRMSIEEVCTLIRDRHSKNRDYTIVVVAEGFRLGDQLITKDDQVDEFGHVRLGGVGSIISKEIGKHTNFDSRVVVLGHLQRGGTPSALDRYLGLRFGIQAIDMVLRDEFGKMLSLQGNAIVPVDLSAASENRRVVDKKLYDEARVFFG